MNVEVLNTGNVRLAWLQASMLERAGIRTVLAIDSDDLFGAELFCVMVDVEQEPRARAMLAELEGRRMVEGDDGTLVYADA